MNLRELETKLLEHPDLSGLSADEQFELIAERAAHFVGEERLRAALKTAVRDHRPLRVKYGIDATGREIHLGHAVPLFLLRRIQNMGHHVVLLIGDFTARVGDPSGRVSTRPMLSDKEIKDNAVRFTEQAGKILDVARTEVRFNSEWLETLPLTRFFKILSGLSVSTALARKDFRERETITRAELLYSTLMAVDSVQLETELELGGDDQLLNFHDAVRVMENEGLSPESAVTTGILLGTSGDGTKMSKSAENFISVLAPSADKFGKLMSIPDSQLEQYFKLLTDIRDAEWSELAVAMASGALNPMQAKRLLARVLVADLDGLAAALAVEEDFNRRVVRKDVPVDVPVTVISAKQTASWVAVLRALQLPKIKTNVAARRLLEGGGIHRKTADGEQVINLDDPVPSVGEIVVVRIGKRDFVKLERREL